MFTEKRAPLFCQFFLGLVTTQKTIYLFVEISFFLHIGTPPIKTGHELVYYHLSPSGFQSSLYVFLYVSLYLCPVVRIAFLTIIRTAR